MGDDLPNPVRGGGLRVPALPHHGQARRRGHLDHRQRSLPGVDRRNQLPVGPGHRNGHRLGPDGLEEALHRPFAPVRHRHGNHLTLRKKLGNGLLGNAADLQTGEGSLKGVRYDNTFFHPDYWLTTWMGAPSRYAFTLATVVSMMRWRASLAPQDM